MKKNVSFSKRRMYVGILFIIPLIAGVVFIFFPTLVKTVQFSFNDILITGEGYELKFTGIQYYKEALTQDPYFIPYLIQSIRTLAVNIVVITVFSLFISTILNQKFHGRIIARIIFFVPVILSTGVIISLDSGAMNLAANGAVELGNSSDTSGFLQFTKMLESLNFNDFLVSVVVSAVSNIYNVVRASGMQIFIFLAGLQEIPGSLYEAASVEGCSKWELFWKITFPMISPQIAVNVVYTIVDACTQNSELFNYTSELAFDQGRYGLSTSMSVLYLLCLGIMLAVVFAVLSKFTFKRGEI